MNTDEKRNLAFAEREAVIQGALHGLNRIGDDFEIDEDYTKHLFAIKYIYSRVYETGDDTLPETDFIYDEKKMLIDLAVAFGAWLFVYVILAGFVKGFIYQIAILLQMVYLLVSAQYLYKLDNPDDTTKVTMTVPLAVCYVIVYVFSSYKLISGRVGVFLITVAFALICLRRYLSYKKYEKRFTNAYSDARNLRSEIDQELEKHRSALIDMLPIVRKKLIEYQDAWKDKYADVIFEEDMFSEEALLPLSYWWMVPVEKLLDTYTKQSENIFSSWKVFGVKKSVNNAFDVSGEYSPLTGICQFDASQQMKLHSTLENTFVVEACSQLTQLGIRKKVTSYRVPAHSDLERYAARAATFVDASNIDSAYNSGKINKAEYYQSITKMMTEIDLFVTPYINETKTEERVENIPVHSQTVLWTGQFILAPDSLHEGCYVLYDYFCRTPSIYENLSVLKDYPVSRVHYEYKNVNPLFLARFYALYPDAL